MQFVAWKERLHLLRQKHCSRPVGRSGDGGVRETMRVELTSGGGAFPAWGMGERCKPPPSGSGAEPQQLCNFYNVEVTKHRIIA